MESQLKEIFESVQKLLGLHRQLLDAVRLERDALVNADLKAIQETTCSKEALIEAIRAAESQRLKQTALLAISWKRPLKELTLPNIVIAIQGKDPKSAEMIRSAHVALNTLVGRVIEQNDYNRQLIEKSLEHVNQMKRNVLGEAAPRSDTYTQQGQKAAQGSGSRLISKEA